MSQSPLYPVHREPPPPYRESHLTKILAVLLLVVAGMLIFFVIKTRKQNESSSSYDRDRPAAEPRTIAQRPDDKLGADESNTIQIFDEVSPEVVHITSLETHRDRMTLDETEIPQGVGTGFIWDSDGHIVTNFHVVQHGNAASVTLKDDNKSYPAKIVGVAPDKDLAVLHIDAPPARLKKVSLGESAKLKVGQKVLAIGNPFGLDQTLTTGVISGLGREMKSPSQRSIFDVIQTDASINPGNSGGPLLDSAGRLIGINTAIYSPSGSSAGIGFAVPVDTINQIVPQLISHGKMIRPGMGINILSDQIARQQRVDGVVVLGVSPGGAADRAGITGTKQAAGGGWELGDVIVKVDDVDVKQSSDLFKALDAHKVGDEVDVVLENQGSRRTVKVRLQALP